MRWCNRGGGRCYSSILVWSHWFWRSVLDDLLFISGTNEHRCPPVFASLWFTGTQQEIHCGGHVNEAVMTLSQSTVSDLKKKHGGMWCWSVRLSTFTCSLCLPCLNDSWPLLLLLILLLALSSPLKCHYFLPSQPGFHLCNPKWINIHYRFHGGSVIKGCFWIVFRSTNKKKTKQKQGTHPSKVRTDLNGPP